MPFSEPTSNVLDAIARRRAVAEALRARLAQATDATIGGLERADERAAQAAQLDLRRKDAARQAARQAAELALRQSADRRAADDLELRKKQDERAEGDYDLKRTQDARAAAEATRQGEDAARKRGQTIASAIVDADMVRNVSPDETIARAIEVVDAEGGHITEDEVAALIERAKAERVAEMEKRVAEKAAGAGRGGGHGGRGAAPTEPKLGSKAMNDIADRNAQIAQIEDVIAKVEKVGTGPMSALRAKAAELASYFPGTGEAAAEYLDPGMGINSLKAAMERLAAEDVHRLAGSSVTDNEKAAFHAFQASIHQPMPVALAKLREFVAAMKAANAGQARLVGGVPPAAPAPDDEPAPRPVNTSAFDAWKSGGRR